MSEATDAGETKPRAPVTFFIPASSARGTCRSCSREGYWIKTDKGKSLFVEVDPANPDHRDTLLDVGGFGQAHFATCPEARQWSKRNG